MAEAVIVYLRNRGRGHSIGAWGLLLASVSLSRSAKSRFFCWGCG